LAVTGHGSKPTALRASVLSWYIVHLTMRPSHRVVTQALFASTSIPPRPVMRDVIGTTTYSPWGMNSCGTIACRSNGSVKSVHKRRTASCPT
jgi:hypothetical protein